MRGKSHHRFILILFCLLGLATNHAASVGAASAVRNPQRPQHVRVTSGEAATSHGKIVTPNVKERSSDLGSRQRGRRRMRGSDTNDAPARPQRRQLGKSGGKGSSSGGSGGSGGSSGGSGGSSGSSSHSGAGWDEFGNYCGCLCDSSASSNAYGSCEYAVHASDVYRIGNSDQAQNADGEAGDNEDGDGANVADGDGTDASSSSSGQQSDIVAVVSTSDSDYDPLLAFNITESDTFCNLWQYDWLDSCNTGDCQCPFTEELLAQNRLSCSDAWDCPSDCPVCLQCMRQNCGYSVMAVSAVRTGTKVLPAAVAILTTFLAVCYIIPKRRKKKGGLLGESLMDSGTEMSESLGKTWMVPVSEDGLPTETGEVCKPVWLAPINKKGENEMQSAPMLPSKQKREETAMLVVVPRPRATEANQKAESVFPDILKDSGEDGATSDSAAIQTGGTVTKKPEEEEFTPGLWLVPLSQESVASSISESIDKDDTTIGSETEENDSTSSSSDGQTSDPSTEEESNGKLEPASRNQEERLVVDAPAQVAVVKPRKEESPLPDDASFHSSTASTISSKDDSDDGCNEEEDRSIGSSEGEI